MGTFRGLSLFIVSFLFITTSATAFGQVNEMLIDLQIPPTAQPPTEPQSCKDMRQKMADLFMAKNYEASAQMGDALLKDSTCAYKDYDQSSTALTYLKAAELDGAAYGRGVDTGFESGLNLISAYLSQVSKKPTYNTKVRSFVDRGILLHDTLHTFPDHDAFFFRVHLFHIYRVILMVSGLSADQLTEQEVATLWDDLKKSSFAINQTQRYVEEIKTKAAELIDRACEGCSDKTKPLSLEQAQRFLRSFQLRTRSYQQFVN